MSRLNSVKRDWLNPKSHADTGAVSTSVEIEKMHDGKQDLDCYLQIRDCGRQIELDFCCRESIRQINQRRKKLEILRSHLDFVSSALDQMESIVRK